MVFAILTTALGEAADDDGLIKDYEDHTFFERYVIPAIGIDPEDLAVPITYDTFTAMTLTEGHMELVRFGFLATQADGDRMDLHLALPPTIR